MLKKSILPLVICANLLGGCGSDNDAPTEVEANNQPPVVSADFTPLIEKSVASLSVVAEDSDGSIVSYAWSQTAGPELSFSGGDTATINFTAPSVVVDTLVSFTVSVTDNEGAVTQVSADTSIARIENIYDLSGQVVGATYDGAMVSTSVGDESAEAAADDSGQFSVRLAVDDDVPLTSSVKLIATSTTGLQLVSLVPSLAQISDFITQPSGVKRLKAAAVADSQPIVVSAVSTALYSLIVAANDGVEPGNIDVFELVESQVDPDALIEAAAVVQILINSEQPMLPEGTDLVSVLADTQQYNALVEVIEQLTPGAITAMVEEILDDPVLTPPVSATDIPPLYYQTSPVAESFIARGGSRYQFNADNTGQNSTSYGVHTFEWTLQEGDILLTYGQGTGAISYEAVEWVPGLTQAQKDALYEARIYQVEVRIATVTERMKRLTTGAAMDTFRVESVSEWTMTPVDLGAEVITTAPWSHNNESDVLMRRSAAGGVEFKAADIAGLWGLEIYNPMYYDSNAFEVLEFLADGTGMSQDSGSGFTWSVSEGRLQLVFETFNQSFSVINSQEGDLAVYSEVSDKEGELLASLFGFATEIAQDTGFSDDNLVTGAEHYWQTMVNQWTLGSWDGDKLYYCYENNCDYGSVFFGFQALADNTGTKFTWSEGTPPELSNYSGNEMLWSINDDGELSHGYVDYLCEDKAEPCRQRTWRLLKIVDGRLGKRIYVQEADRRRSKSTDEWSYGIDPRWNMYELIELEYFNKVAAASEAAVRARRQGVSARLDSAQRLQRKILEPSGSARLAR
ncbi:hypothetical protein L1D40_08970 [Shewanella insulae]|uniref:PKD domain-containing protein n=1 Tax=Shewanella insulae TaxID=2681496 RepID=UPI001EFE27E3|nr:hypothetical protein [Shewanella insulae]MCG9755346.1 hypothetical protein [Shewanella insulae]